MGNGELFLGQYHWISIAEWNPELSLNPQYVKWQDFLPLKCTGIVRHKLPDGSDCTGAITFDSIIARELFSGPFWTVESWEPLTLSPSLLCHCGDHGWIKRSLWVSA